MLNKDQNQTLKVVLINFCFISQFGKNVDISQFWSKVPFPK